MFRKFYKGIITSLSSIEDEVCTILDYVNFWIESNFTIKRKSFTWGKKYNFLLFYLSHSPTYKNGPFPN